MAPQRAGLDIADRRWQRVEGDHDVAADKIVGERASSFIGDDRDVGARHRLELFGAEIIQRRRRRRADRDLIAVFLGERDHFGQRFRRHRRIGHDHDRHRRDQADRRKILSHVVAGFFRKAGTRDQKKQRVAVRLRSGDVARSDHRACARAVDDDHLLAERVAELLRNNAADGIDATAGGKSHDQ